MPKMLLSVIILWLFPYISVLTRAATFYRPTGDNLPSNHPPINSQGVMKFSIDDPNAMKLIKIWNQCPKLYLQIIALNYEDWENHTVPCKDNILEMKLTASPSTVRRILQNQNLQEFKDLRKLDLVFTNMDVYHFEIDLRDIIALLKNGINVKISFLCETKGRLNVKGVMGLSFSVPFFELHSDKCDIKIENALIPCRNYEYLSDRGKSNVRVHLDLCKCGWKGCGGS